MRYVVGYTPNESGSDAIDLAATIARAQGASLEVVYVARNAGSFAYLAPSSEGSVATVSEEQVRQIRTAAEQNFPDDVAAEFRLVESDSFANGLIDTARELGASLIVVGAATNSLISRFTVGSVANALLHASPVPVALAPKGYRRRKPLTRLTVLVGTREGAEALVDVAVSTANRRHLPLRLVSIVELDAAQQNEYSDGSALSPARQHANDVLAKAAHRAEGEVTVTVAHGNSIEDAVDSIGWENGELVIVGSSRLAQRNLLFLGSTANKVLRALPVPMVVVPRDYNEGSESGETIL